MTYLICHCDSILMFVLNMSCTETYSLSTNQSLDPIACHLLKLTYLPLESNIKVTFDLDVVPFNPPFNNTYKYEI